MRRGEWGVSGYSVISRALAVVAVALVAACAEAPPPAPPAPPMADRVVVHKSTRTLNLLRDGKVLASFPVALGRDPFGPKQREGDGKTPEGVYRIDYKSMQSRYTRALHVSYPDDNDRARAQAMNVDPGGAIFVHGLPNEYGQVDPDPRLTFDLGDGHNKILPSVRAAIALRVRNDDRDCASVAHNDFPVRRGNRYLGSADRLRPRAEDRPGNRPDAAVGRRRPFPAGHLEDAIRATIARAGLRRHVRHQIGRAHV